MCFQRWAIVKDIFSALYITDGMPWALSPDCIVHVMLPSSLTAHTTKSASHLYFRMLTAHYFALISIIYKQRSEGLT